jgi:hypothetical protein
VLLDALGYLQLGEMMRADPSCLWNRLAARGRLLPLTSVYPSTTATALATLMSGATPLGHGLLGYELWLREYGALTEMLSLKPAYGTGKETLLDWGMEPERFLPVPGLGALLAAQGVETTTLLASAIVRGGLTRMCYRGFGHIYGYQNIDDLWALARYLIRHDHAERSLHFLYWGGVDTAIHRHGAGGGHWQAAYHAATRSCEERLLSQLTPAERQGTLFILVADHGFLDTPEALAHDTDADPRFRARLAVPYSGESRAAYLHSLDGDSPATLAALEQTLGPDFLVRRSEEVIAAGLFGPPSSPAPESLARLGQLMVIPRGGRYLDRREVRKRVHGRHGGLSAAEMLVPWLAVRLDD